MATPSNVLQTVQLYNKAHLAFLNNSYVAMSLWNKKFKNFQTEGGNLGSSTTFDLPPRVSTADGLVAAFQSSVQRVQTLTCDTAANASFAYTNQERLFNVDKPNADNYMKEFGMSWTRSFAAKVESNILKDIDSSRPVNTIVNGQTVPTGALHTESGPYQFFGDGVTDVTTFQQLEQMVQNFRSTGSADEIWVILPNTKVPAIVGSGLTQFAMNRNNELANSWEIGNFGTPIVKYFSSNLLPYHTSGNVGNTAPTGNQLTVISTNDPTGANITQITLSGATASDLNAIYSGDLFSFVDGISGKANVRKTTFIGNIPTNQVAQNRVVGNSPADSSGNVIINLAVPFQSTGLVTGTAQTINTNIVAGMKLKFVPSHQCGILVTANAGFLSMPKLPDQEPFPTSVEQDMDSGMSLRMTKGARFGENFQGWILDGTWGSTIVPEDSMRMIFTA